MKKRFAFIVLWIITAYTIADSPITIFHAKKFITMEPAWPEAHYVAVNDGIILGVGNTMDDLKAWTDTHKYQVDEQFSDKILLPGFVEPHLHLLLGALSFPSVFATPDPWQLPQGLVEGVLDKQSFLKRIEQGDQDLKGTDDWLFVFGYANSYHGEVTRADLDKISLERPIAVSSRSTHVWVLNSKALELSGVNADDAKKLGLEAFVNLKTGTFKEGGTTDVLLPKISPWLMAPDRIQQGLTIAKDTLHKNGVTTLHEPGTGIFTVGYPEKEMKALLPIFQDQKPPMRTYLTPRAEMAFSRFKDNKKKTIDFLTRLPELNQSQVKFLPKRAKIYVDGSYVDQVGVYEPPGYVDAHKGLMMTPIDKLHDYGLALWREGYAIHVHVMGDKGTRIAVDLLEYLQNKKPRRLPEYTLEHINAASPEDLRRAAKLGANASCLIWPLFSVGEQFAEKVLGVDRIYTGFPLKTILQTGMTLGIHADTPVSPPQPLLLVWMAVNRIGPSGEVLGNYERLSVDEALRAVTIGPARILRLENEVGSIRAGKKADFAVLEKDPYQVDPKDIRLIPVWGTVFEGKAYPATKKNSPQKS